jgi:hypothetical protein
MNNLLPLATNFFHNETNHSKLIMLLAAIYNLAWGAIISIDPQTMLFSNREAPMLSYVRQ